jgi:hypothetical protein
MARDVLIDDGARLIYLGFIAVDVECKAGSDLYILLFALTGGVF